MCDDAAGKVLTMFNLNSKFIKSLAFMTGTLLAVTILTVASPAEAAFRPPVMATINPSEGTVTGGDFITITGQNLNSVTDIKVGANTVWRNDIQRSNVGEWITFRTPYSPTTGPADVTFYSDVNVTEPDFYNYTASGITSVTPNLGTFRGGTTVTIKGTGFGPMEWGNGSLVVKFNGALATGIKRVSPTQITAITPAGTKGDAKVEVSFSNDTVRRGLYSANVFSLNKAFLYTPEVLAPKIDSINPDKGAVAGGTEITISGRYLRGSDNLPATFTIGGKPTTNVVVTEDGLSATMLTPANPAGTVDVVAKNVDSTTTMSSGFTYANAPTISGVTAPSGVLEGGTLITINGTNFGATGMPTVKVGGKPALCVKLVSPTQVTAVTKDGVAGTVDVEITPTTGGGTATKAGAYTYEAATTFPTISSITPDSGPVAGANTVEIKSAAAFPAGTPNVMFGSACALSVTRVDDKTIRATVPSNAPGARNVSLTFANGYALLSSGYTYFIPAPPEVTSVTPAADWTIGGANVVIAGNGFGNSGTPIVKFGTALATNVVRVSDKQITATVPANTAGAKDVSVTPTGFAAITKSAGFTYKSPIINNVTPNSGLFSGGTNVVINGDGFGLTGTPIVKFNGKSATNIVRLDGTSISATTPAGDVGFASIEVIPTGGTSIINKTVFAYFALQVAPQIDASSLTWLPAAGGAPVTVNGSNFIGTDGKPGKVYINGALIAATISKNGKSISFTTPALAPSYSAYEFKVITNEGTAWKAIFQVAKAPAAWGNCDGQTDYARNIDSGGNRTLYFDNGALLLNQLGTPTVSLNGSSVTVVSAGNTGGEFPRDYVRFTIPENSTIPMGPVSTVVTLGQNAGSVTSNCFYRHAAATISADDKTIIFGNSPDTFTKSVVGERGTDKVTTVSFTFTGIDGTNYPSSTVVPTAAGRYQIRPSNAAMSPGDLGNYDFDYRDGVFVIQGIPVTITATQCDSKIYGDPNPTLNYSKTGLPATESIAAGSIKYIFDGYSLSGDRYGPTQTWPTHAGTYTITPDEGLLVSGNTASISFTYVPCEYVIAKRPVSISALDTTKTYGSDDPSRPWTFTNPGNKNLAPGDSTLFGSPVVDREEGENVGTYNYVLTRMDDLNPDYDITYAYWGKLTINKKRITLTGVNTSKNYCQPDPTLLYSASGLVRGDTLSGALSRTAGINLGDYAYNNGTLDGGNNYTLAPISGGKLTITTCPLDVWANDTRKMYGDVDPTFSYSFGGENRLINGDTLSGALTRVSGANVGLYTINKGTLASSSNYTITFHTGSLEIYKRPICVAADDKAKTYGDADPAFTKTAVINTYCFALVGSDSISGTMSRDPGQGVGVYSITPGTLSAGSNYQMYVTSGALTINPRPITITPAAKTKTYGDNDPVLNYSITSGSLGYTDSLVGEISRESGENAGNYGYVIGNFGYYNPNYNITVNNTNRFTINKKHITVSGVDTQKYYGEADPELKYSSSGLLWWDSLSGSISRATGETVGNYNYSQGTLTGGSNYIIDSVTGGKLVILKRPIDVCAGFKSKTYGDADPALTYENCGSYWLVNGDSFTGSIARNAGSNVGSYAITKGTLALSSNYELTYHQDNLQIDPKTIYIDAANKTKVYGNVDPSLTWSMASGYAWVGADSPTVNLSRDSGENVGNYNINLGGVVGGSNYNVIVKPAVLEITKRDVTIKPNAKSKLYGDNDPDFPSFGASDYSVTSGSLKSGDALYLAMGRTSGEDVGQYSYTTGDLNYYNTNYNITVDASNKFSINVRPITVTAVADSKQYGTADNNLTYTTSLNSLPNGTTVALSGSLTRTAGEAVSSVGYDINQGTVTTANNANFSVSYVGAKLKITKRDLKLCAADKEITYGDSRPANSFSICEGATAFTDAVSSVTFSYSSPNPPSDAGSYKITPGAAVFSSGTSANYNISYGDGTLTINPRQIHLIADDKSKLYGQVDPTFSYQISSGALVGSPSYTGALSRDPGQNIGDYSIRLGTLSLGSNYVITVDGGKLTINKRPVKVTPKPNQKKTYGDNNPVYTYDTDITLPYSESLNGQLGRSAGEDVAQYDYNLGTIEGSNPNYSVTLDPVNKFKIEKFVVTITVNNLEKFYGEADPSYTYNFTPAVLGNGSGISVTGAPTRIAGENVGDYVISVGTLAAGPNFTATITAGSKLTIKKRPITIKAADQSSVYAQALPSNSVSVVQGNLVGAETISGATYTYSTANPVHVGSFTITPSAATIAGGLVSNYEISYLSGTLNITKATLTIQLANSNSDWGDQVNPGGIRTATGLKTGDTIGNIDYTYDAAEAKPTFPGDYAVAGVVTSFSAGSIDDYNITVLPAKHIINPPYFVGIDPKRGPEAGGTRFTINGYGFGFNNPTVKFDGIEATGVTLLGSNQITGLTPPHVKGLVAVTLITDSGTLELGKVFSYYPPIPTPSILALTPNQGPSDGGTKVTVNGSAFIGDDKKPALVYLDGVLATDIVVSKDGKSLTFTSPAHAAGLVDVEVVTKNGRFTFTNGFEYIKSPIRKVTSTGFIIFNGDSSFLLAPAKAALDKLLSGIPKKATILSIDISGWVKKTSSTAIDAKLSKARAQAATNYLSAKGLKGKFVLNAKGIYNTGTDQDRRADIIIDWQVAN
ncbi:MAG: hypothetical protein EBS85_01830 [Micrococcales bacterium]|nr:hypothetical protein [Micrococcales bacterium]